MIDSNNMSKLYDCLIVNKELTTKKLNECGFNAKDLSDLVKNGTLERIKKGYYAFLLVDDLYRYGKKLIAQKEYEKVQDCFNRCYEINPNHLGTCFQLFLQNIRIKNYEKALEYFERFYNNQNEYYNIDSNFYLYLLNYITEIKEEYQKYAKYLEYDDFKISASDKRYEDYEIHNKIRSYCENQKFSYALFLLNNHIKQKKSITIQETLTKELIKQAIDVQNKNQNEILILLKNQNYEGLVNMLESMENRHRLSFSNNYTLILAKTLLSISNSQVIPLSTINDTNNIFAAIDGQNYPLALKLSTIRNKENNIDENTNSMHILLQEINDKITELNKSKKTINKEVVKKETTPQVKPEKKVTTLGNILNLLLDKDLTNAFKEIRIFLENIDKKEYTFLIENLVNISLIEKDIIFSKPILVLRNLQTETYTFNINEYIQNFYFALANNQINLAQLYLNIIRDANLLGLENTIADKLDKILKISENNLPIEIKNEAPEETQALLPEDKNLDETTEVPMDTSLVEETNLEKEPKVILKKKQSNLAIPNENEVLEKMVHKYVNRAIDKGLAIFDEMSEEKMNKVLDILEPIPNIRVDIIDYMAERIAITFHNEESFNYEQTIKEGKNAYINNDFDTCIASYSKFVEEGRAKAYIYLYIGLSYMKKNDYKTAIDYFIMTTWISAKENAPYDISPLIEKLRGNDKEEENIKKYVKMKESEFNDDIDNYYDLPIEEIRNLSSEYSIDEISEILKFSEEEKQILYLIYAREYFICSNFTMGNKILQKVSQFQNKTPFVKNLFKEINTNKKYYCNRLSSPHISLVLKIVE